MLQILPALHQAPLVAGLVLCGDQRVGTAALFRCQVKVARSGPDALFDVAPSVKGCFQSPLPLTGVNQERA
jgi:hypothetical protein